MASSGPRADADTAGSSDDEERNELLAMLREASSDEEEDGMEMLDDDDEEEMDQSVEPKVEGEEEIDVEGSEVNEDVDSGKNTGVASCKGYFSGRPCQSCHKDCR